MVLSFGNPDLTVVALRAAENAGFSARELLVVDNGSDSASYRELLEQLGGRFEVLRFDKNQGIPAALNGGINALFSADPARTAAMVIMNDVVIADTDLSLLLRELDVKHVAAVAPVQCLTSSPNTVHSAGGLINRSAWITSHRYNGSYYQDLPSEIPDAGYLDNSCVIIRRAAWEELGEFRADLHLYWEDVEWSLRARAAGWRLRVVNTPCLHIVGGTMGTGVSKVAIARSAHSRWVVQRWLARESGFGLALAPLREFARLTLGGRRRSPDARIQLAAWWRVFFLRAGPGDFLA
jgi:GT2 family glycosyltransferase